MVVIIRKKFLLKDDQMIEKLLNNKIVECNEKKGKVVNFFNCALSDVQERKIAGTILEDGSEIIFTDDLEITIL